MSKASSIKIHAFSALFFCAAIFGFFPEIFLAGKVFIAKGGDFHLSTYSFSYYFKEAMKDGLLPIWNPYVFCGYPFGAAAVSDVNLTYWLAFLLNDINKAWNTRILLNVFLAAMLTYGYLWKMGCGGFGAALAGLIFAFAPASGSYVDSWAFFIPLTLLLAECYAASRKLRYLIFIVLSFAVLFLTALPQYSLYASVFFALYTLIRFKSLFGVFTLLFAAGAVSFYTFRLFEALSLSPRGKLWFMTVLLPTHFIDFLFPYFYESPYRPETNFFFAKGFYALTEALFHTRKIQYLTPPYLGILGFAFVLLARKAKGLARFYWGSVILILFYMMTFPLFSPFYKHIPILAQLPRLSRLGAVLTFSLAVLAGLGADRVIRREVDVKRMVQFLLGILFFVVMTLSVFRFAVRWQEPAIREFTTNYIQEHVVGNPQYQAPREFYLARTDEFLDFLDQWTNVLGASIGISVLFISASVFLLILWQKRKLSGGFFPVLVLFLLYADFFVLCRGFERGLSLPKELKISTPVTQFLERDSEIFRIMPILEPAEFGAGRIRSDLAGNANMLYPVMSVEGWDAFHPKRYGQFFKSFQSYSDTDPALVMGGAEEDFDYEIMRFLNVKYFLARKDVVLKNDLPVAVQDESHKLFLNRGYYPRAFLVYDYQVIEELSEVLPFLKTEGFLFDQTVVLEERPSENLKMGSIPPGANRGDVRIQEYEPHHIRVQIKAPQDAFLVMTDNQYPGWEAELDGQPAKIYTANYSFRAVAISKGEHELQFHYRPASYRNGLLVSGAAILFGISLIAYAGIRRGARV